MKEASSKQIAIFIAIITAIISSIIGVFLNLTDSEFYYLVLVFSLLVVFLIIYILTHYMLNNYIIGKINPIYKTIHNLNVPENELYKNIEDKDLIEEVKKEVIDWAKDKTQEIQQLKKLEKYRKEFLGNVSHELKTPIFNIQGYVLTLLDGGLDDPSINKEYLKKTEKSINRMISIVNDLEAISLLESGEPKLEFETFDIVLLVKEVFEIQQMRAEKMNISLKFEKNYDKPIIVYADRKKIFEVLENLIVNSIMYSKENGKTIVSFFNMGENILIDITDNGIGISNKYMPRLFERFFRVDKSRSRDQGGTGLGLAIVKHIIEAHNQTINVRSTIGKGSSFAFTLKMV